MRIRNVTRTSHYIEIDDNIELEVVHEPLEWDTPMAERIGNRIVVGYLSHDDSADNPMNDRDCQGNLYLWGSKWTIWDNRSEMASELGIDSYGNPDIDRTFYLDGGQTTLRELGERRYRENHPDLGPDDFDEISIEEHAFDLYLQHWRAIVGPYVVPVYYNGGQETYIRPTEWDGDPNDLPDGVWVADKGAIENIVAAATKPDADRQPGEKALLEQATKYAEITLQELQDWCNGRVYGVCVEVFEGDAAYPDHDWERITEDACWGYIGDDYAKQELKDQFDAEVNSQRKEQS